MLKDSDCKLSISRCIGDQLVAILDPAEEAIELSFSDRQGQLIIGTIKFKGVESVMHLSLLSPRVGRGGRRATHGKLTERAFPWVGI